jgi:energy-coupling factor transporter ATP-binding protein EcfA2
MKVREINIEKFRSIEGLHLTFENALGKIQPITVLAGPNGCGKTSVLFAIIQALRGLMKYRTDDVPEPTDLDIHRHQNGEFLSLTPPKISVHLQLEFSEEEKTAIGQVWEDTGALRKGEDGPQYPLKLPAWIGTSVSVDWKYPPNIGPDGDSRPTWFVEKVTPWDAMHWFEGRLFAIRGYRRGLLRTPELIEKVGGPLLFPQDRSLRSRVTGAGSPTDRDRELTVWEILKELGQRATSPSVENQSEGVQLKEQAQRSEERIKQSFSEICSPKKYLGFAYTPNDPSGSPYFLDGKSHYPLSMASSGEQVVLEYITRLTFPNTMNHGLVLIDEPEVHLHPGWVRQLYRALRQMGNDNQFILTTHSQELRTMAAEDGVLIDLGNLH